jgi:probable rRNA maturation factor
MPRAVRKPMRDPEPELRLAVQFASEANELPTRAQVRRWVAAALEHSAEITVRIVDADEAQALNRLPSQGLRPQRADFRIRRDQPRWQSGRGVLGGDVVICAPVVEREAREQRKPLKDHYAHMTVHGVLHLQGYDHLDPAEADIMESREIAILKRFHIPNPYTS